MINKQLPTRAKLILDTYRDAKKNYYNNISNDQERLDILAYFCIQNVNDYLSLIQKTKIYELPFENWKQCLDDYSLSYKKSIGFISHQVVKRIRKTDDLGKIEPTKNDIKVGVAWANFMENYHKAMRDSLIDELVKIQDDFIDTIRQCMVDDSYNSLCWKFIYNKSVKITVNSKNYEIKNTIDLTIPEIIDLYLSKHPDLRGRLAEYPTKVYSSDYDLVII